MRDWRGWVAVLGIAATAGVGAGMLTSLGAGGYLSLRIVAAVCAVVLGAAFLSGVVALGTRNLLVVAFFVWSALTVIWSTDVTQSLTSVIGIGSVIVLAVCLTLLQRRLDVERLLMWVFTGTSLVSALVIVLFPDVGTVFVTHPTEGDLVQPIGVFIWNSDLGFSSSIAAVIAFGVGLRERRWWLLPVAVGNAAMVWVSNSAASLIVLLAGLFFVTVLQSRRVAAFAGGIVGVGALIGAVALGPVGLLDAILGLQDRSVSLTGRVNLWTATLGQAAEHPLIGHGAGVEPDLARITTAVHAHNGFVQILFDRGVIGLVLLTAVIMYAAVRGLRDKDRIGFALVVMVVVANLANNYLTYASLGLAVLLWQSYAQLPGEASRRAVAPTAPRPGVIWVSAEVREEIDEILLLISRAWRTDPRHGRAFSAIRIDAPRDVLAKMDLPRDIDGTSVVAAPYEHRVGLDRIAKVRGLVAFAGRALRRRPALIFSGFSMMKHRLVSGWLEVRHVAYIRGVVFDPAVSVGTSDSIRFGKLARIVPRRIVATYSADLVLTVGEVNREFLIGRGIPDDQVRVVGPVWLDDSTRPPASTHRSPGERAYFLTGAWEAHGRMEEHHAQLALTRRLAAEWPGPTTFALRVHPRDNYPYSDDPAFAGVPVDRSLPGEFLAGLQDSDLLIAPLSTLAFEAIFLGRGVVFYADPAATMAYFHIYERLGIAPKNVDDLLDGRIEAQRALSAEVFSPIDFSAVRGVL